MALGKQMKNESRSRADIERPNEVALITMSLMDNECQKECRRENKRDYKFLKM